MQFGRCRFCIEGCHRPIAGLRCACRCLICNACLQRRADVLKIIRLSEEGDEQALLYVGRTTMQCAYENSKWNKLFLHAGIKADMKEGVKILERLRRFDLLALFNAQYMVNYPQFVSYFLKSTQKPRWGAYRTCAYMLRVGDGCARDVSMAYLYYEDPEARGMLFFGFGDHNKEGLENCHKWMSNDELFPEPGTFQC